MIYNQFKILVIVLLSGWILMGCTAPTNTAPITPSPTTQTEVLPVSLTDPDTKEQPNALDVVPALDDNAGNPSTDAVPALTIPHTSSPMTVNLKDLTIAEFDENGQPTSRPEPHKPETLARLIELTKQDLAQQLTVPVTDITLTKATFQEWSDSSLGCPQVDTIYTAQLTPGYQLTFMVGNLTYTYHTDTHTRFLWCP